MVWNILLIDVDQLFQLCVLTVSWPTPDYFWRDRLGKGLSTVQALFSDNQNSGVLSTVLVTNAKKPQEHTGCCEEN